MGLFGFVLSALKIRKKLTTKERLQHIDDQLEKININLKRNRQLQKSVAITLLTISVFLYIPCIAIFYTWYMPKVWIQRLLYSVPFLIFPFLVFLLKKLIHHMFINRISNNAISVKELKIDKKKILETVMDTETYKVAKELLQIYDPNRSLVEQADPPIKQSPSAVTEGQDLRRRTVQSVGSATPTHSTSNGYPRSPAPSQRMPSVASPIMRTPVPAIRGPVHRIPVPIAPILPRYRSVFDKVADYFIGDGPSNRFALICKQCYGHNGMVLVEEFQFTSYKCCYCNFFNPAKKQRLNAPKLESRTPLKNKHSSESANSTDAETSVKGEDNDDKGDTNVENNTPLEDGSTKQIEEKVIASEPTGETHNGEDSKKEDAAGDGQPGDGQPGDGTSENIDTTTESTKDEVGS